MISSLKGKVETIGADFATINVGGIGFQVFMPTSTISTLTSAGEEARVHTHLHLREDSVTLFGFATTQELALFQLLIGVTGLGPRLALALLSALATEQLTMAIVTGQTDVLTITPGVGKKVAERIILELKEKLGAGWAATPAAQIAQENSDVLGALTSLGYSAAEAQRAVATLPAATDMSLEERIKHSLQFFNNP